MKVMILGLTYDEIEEIKSYLGKNVFSEVTTHDELYDAVLDNEVILKTGYNGVVLDKGSKLYMLQYSNFISIKIL